jgi:hypothetical protein
MCFPLGFGAGRTAKSGPALIRTTIAVAAHGRRLELLIARFAAAGS